MRSPCLWGRCQRLSGGGRIHRLACATKPSIHAKAGPSQTTSDQDHLQRSLELGPALKQAPDFEYVAVAFRSQPRPKRSKAQQRNGLTSSKHKDGLSKIFGTADDGRTYRALETVSGDRRLLFEPAAGPMPPAELPDAVAAIVQPDRHDGADGAAATGTRPTRRRLRQAGRVAKPAPHPPSASAAAAAAANTTSPSSPETLSSAGPSTVPTRHSPAPPGPPRPPAGLSTDTPSQAVAPASPPPPLPPTDATAPLHPLHHPQPSPQQQPQQQQQQRVQHRRGRGRAAAAPASERLAAAAAVLQLPLTELRSHRGFCSELRALDLTPGALADLRGALVDSLGLAPPQLRAALLCQPHLLRLPPCTLARRGAELALELALPPPPGPGGGGPLAAIVAAVPDVLLRRAGYAGTAAALAAALALPPDEALALLRREPQLLRHPPGFYARGVGQLGEQLGLALEAAAALAAAEPQLLAVSPGVLRANGAMLRSLLQLSREQLAEVVERAPELLVRSPGVLRGAVQRLAAVLSRSERWRAALPRLLASPHNLAVALSFRSDRYDRLEYLAATGRDRIMGFKEGLSLEDGEFGEVFPEYEYNVWRHRLVLPAAGGGGAQPAAGPAAAGAHLQRRGDGSARGQPLMRGGA
ncbi:hypothetical protein PLESTM_001310500 [Pleodorina starrii]|nr:hypothetical protein PLESTM_001310500 [Pleodorina starrii]